MADDTKKAVLALMLCKASYDCLPWKFFKRQWAKYTGTGLALQLTDYMEEVNDIADLNTYKAACCSKKFIAVRTLPAVNSTLMIAFRGTWSPADVITDLHIRASAWDGIQPLFDGTNAEVWRSLKFHTGFLNACKGFPRECLVSHILGGGKVLLTGHSMGGAIAAILAFGVLGDLVTAKRREGSNFDRGLLDCVQCITFGAPSFCQFIESNLFISCNPTTQGNQTTQSLLDVFTHFTGRVDPITILFECLGHILGESWPRRLLTKLNLHDVFLPEYHTPGTTVCLTRYDVMRLPTPPFFTQGADASCFEETVTCMSKLSILISCFSSHFLYTYTELVFKHVYNKALRQRENVEWTNLYLFLTEEPTKIIHSSRTTQRSETG